MDKIETGCIQVILKKVGPLWQIACTKVSFAQNFFFWDVTIILLVTLGANFLFEYCLN